MNGNEYGTHAEGQSSVGIGIQTGGMGPQSVQRSQFSAVTDFNGSVGKFSQNMVTVLMNEVKLLLDFEYNPAYHNENLELAAVLLDEAVKYSRVYPKPYVPVNESAGSAAKHIKEWNAGNSWKEIKRKE